MKNYYLIGFNTYLSDNGYDFIFKEYNTFPSEKQAREEITNKIKELLIEDKDWEIHVICGKEIEYETETEIVKEVKIKYSWL